MRNDLFYSGIALLIVGIIFIIISSYFSNPYTYVSNIIQNYPPDLNTLMWIGSILFWIGIIFIILGIVFIPIGAVLPIKDVQSVQYSQPNISQPNQSHNQYVFCSNCDSRNLYNQKFCGECGNKLI